MGDTLTVELISCGRKFGKPSGAIDGVWNCTGIPNPSTSSRRGRTGLDKRLRCEVMSSAGTAAFAEDAVQRICADVNRILDGDAVLGDGRSHLVYAFGCEMGKHRSVSVAVHVGERLKKECVHFMRDRADTMAGVPPVAPRAGDGDEIGDSDTDLRGRLAGRGGEVGGSRPVPAPYEALSIIVTHRDVGRKKADSRRV